MNKRIGSNPIFIACLLVTGILSFFGSVPGWPVAAAVAGEHILDDHTLLLLHFDGDLTGAAGEAPISATGVTFENGIFGTGAYFAPGNNVLFQSMNNIDETEGTLEFWIKPRWNGNDGDNHYMLRYGGGGGMLFGKDAGNFWRSIFNRFSVGGVSENGTGLYIDDWEANAWHHTAFTWDADTLKIYIDGELKSEKDVTIELPIVQDTTFQLGADTSNAYIDSVVDELRISDIARSAEEIRRSYGDGVTIQDISMQPDTVKLLETWWETPDLVAVTNFGTIKLLPSLAQWSTSDETVAQVDQNGRIAAVGIGDAWITAAVDGLEASIHVEVEAPLLDPQQEEISPFLSTPADGYLHEIPVVIITYLPTQDGIYVDEAVTGWNVTLEDTKSRINTLSERAKFMLEEGSRYHGYKDPEAPPSLGYRVIYYLTIYEEVQPGFPVPWNPGRYHPDYNQIMNRIDAEHFVNDLGVKEFWIYGYHHGIIEPAESNMSSPEIGDISNSERYRDDLPVFDHTYVVYNYSFTRESTLHSHGHQLEAILSYINQRQDGNTDLFRKKFVGGDDNGNFMMGRCGNTHMPPNTTSPYDYLNPALVESDIEDWTPEGSGEKKLVNVATWGNLIYAWPDGKTAFAQRTEAQWYMYWMQNMPGHQNCVRYGENYMTNWWLFTADWDAAVNYQGLYSSIPNCAPPSSKEIAIDILPGRYPNRISLKRRGLVPVAILTSEAFNAQNAQPDTCLFAGAAPVSWRMTDVGRDGDKDLLLYYRIKDLDLIAGSTDASLEGETTEGILITGTDSVRIVPFHSRRGRFFPRRHKAPARAACKRDTGLSTKNRSFK